MLGAVFMLLLIYYPNYYHDAETQNQRALLERCSRRTEVDLGDRTLTLTPTLKRQHQTLPQPQARTSPRTLAPTPNPNPN